ncbi:MAG: segregation/condensation protein A [Acidobacteria bacterium]|nr:segregation/condensation protein A [Acidobacteriota bacterium]MDA1233270.1 segregation/condensation protein A [Acidobacteriota bacterium]
MSEELPNGSAEPDKAQESELAVANERAVAEEVLDSDSDDSSGDESRPGGFAIDLPQYEGPLDLLLDLIRKHKINIYDIPIHQITSQYLGYLKQAQNLNIDLGGEFVFMASTLILIKSKTLLPKDPTIPEDEQEDPRDELVRQLLDHEKYVQAAQMLREKRLFEENVWSNPQAKAFLDDEPAGVAADVFDLVKTFEQVLERFKTRPVYDVPDEEVSVASRIEFIKNMLMSEDRPVNLLEVFERQPGVRALVATFLAVLELVKLQAVALRQSELFGAIEMRKHKMFDAVFSEGGPLTSADSEYR